MIRRDEIEKLIKELLEKTKSGRFKWNKQSSSVFFIRKDELQMTLQRTMISVRPKLKAGVILIISDIKEKETILNVDSVNDKMEDLEDLFVEVVKMSEQKGIDVLRKMIEDDL